jgi:hypothetical protein
MSHDAGKEKKPKITQFNKRCNSLVPVARLFPSILGIEAPFCTHAYASPVPVIIQSPERPLARASSADHGFCHVQNT